LNSTLRTNRDREAAGDEPVSLFWSELARLFRHPWQVVRLWNWKSALLSIALRGPIFLVATVRRGWQVSLAAFVTECIFCASTAGFYGAIVQALRNAEPQWLTVTFLTLAVPFVFQVFEYALHRYRGTPHLWIVEIVSVIVSALSALFNWYAMRRGTLLVGGEGGSLGADLRRLPRLVFGFLAALPQRIVRGFKNHSDKIGSSSILSEESHPGPQKCH
jgi:hypothetical protein